MHSSAGNIHEGTVAGVGLNAGGLVLVGGGANELTAGVEVICVARDVAEAIRGTGLLAAVIISGQAGGDGAAIGAVAHGAEHVSHGIKDVRNGDAGAGGCHEPPKRVVRVRSGGALAIGRGEKLATVEGLHNFCAIEEKCICQAASIVIDEKIAADHDA